MTQRYSTGSLMLACLLAISGTAQAADTATTTNRTTTNTTTTTTGTTARDMTRDNDMRDNTAHSDKNFLEAAAKAGMAEVDASKMAANKAADPKVKAFAQQLVDEHVKSNSELNALAMSKGVDLPRNASLMQQAKEKVLSLRDGTGFDKQYVDSFGVNAHEDTVKLFQKAANESKDPDIKAFAARNLPALQHHLQEARDLQATLKDKHR